MANLYYKGQYKGNRDFKKPHTLGLTSYIGNDADGCTSCIGPVIHIVLVTDNTTVLGLF